MNNVARVARIESIRKHPNADRLQIASVCGYPVIVGLDTKEGDLGIYFQEGLQLSPEFCSENNLIRVKNEDGSYSGGMFDTNRRVRAMNLRGVKSDGFWCPISYLDFTNKPYPIEGDSFTEWFDIPICNKYVTPATMRAQANAQVAKAKKKIITFPEHIDTEQWRHAKMTDGNSVVYITEKLHGTSGRYGNVKVDRQLAWWEKLLIRFGVKIQTTEYQYHIGTRRVVMGNNHTGFYGNEQFRYNAVKGINLHEGEILYFELVGYTTDGTPIMGKHDLTADKSVKKELHAKYGNVMVYAYGNAPGNCSLYVYRITQDGHELSWNDVKRRCGELGIKHVPELDSFIVDSNARDYIDTIVQNRVTDESILDSTHIREGVVIRLEHGKGTDWYKEKSFTFKVLEGIVKDQTDYVDIEESA